MINDARGQFQANWAEPRHEKSFPAAVLASLQVTPRAGNEIQVCYGDLFKSLEAELRAVGFLGPLGIDCFVYRETSGALKLKPVVEINPRYTMGRVTVELMKHVCPGSYGVYRLLNRATLKPSGCEDFQSFATKQQQAHPIRLEGAPTARIREGFIALSDPEQAEVCLATFQVFRDQAAFIASLK